MKNLNKKWGIVVEVKDGNLNVALRKFKKMVDDSGRLVEVIEKQFYEKPTEERKRRKGAARARWLKKIAEQELPKKFY